jgi:hypothetical protein
VFPPETFRPLLEEVARLLDANSVRFAITGGLVSAYYSEPRFTQDVDILVDREQITAALESITGGFEAAGYVFDKRQLTESVRTGRPFQLIHARECLKLDLYPRELVPGELGRSTQVELFAGLMLPVVSPADLAISKLIWISRGSHKNRRDFRQLLRRLSTDDIDRVREFAAGRSLQSLLKEVLAEPDEIAE